MKDPGIFYSLVVIALLISCGTKPPHENEKEIKKAKLVENFNDYRGSDLFNFTEVSIGNDQIQMIITYSGGCEKHEFALVGMRAIGKSLPPTRQVMLYHNGNNDTCREFITDTLSFDIKPFQHEEGKSIKLLLEGYDQPLKYLSSN